jgi:fructose transport system permease protein
MVLGVLAVGQTLIVLTAGVDLSCGAVMALGGVVMTKLAAESGLPPAAAVAAGVLATTLFGLANGLLVTLVRLPPFIVTLGTLNVAFALTQLYSGGRPCPTCPPP